jgi:hypothetical protein
MGAPPGTPFAPPKQASILGAMSGTTLLVAAGLLVGAVVLTKFGVKRPLHRGNPRRRRRG